MLCTRRQFTLRLLAGVPVVWSSSSLGGPIASRHISFAFSHDYAPLSYVEAGDEPSAVKGLFPDAVRLLFAERLHIAPVLSGLPWRRAQLLVEQGTIDAFCTFESDERNRYAMFAKEPILVQQPQLFIHADSPKRAQLERVRSRDDLKAFKLIDIRGNNWAEQNLTESYNVEWVANQESIVAMLMAGRCDAFLSSSPMRMKWWLRQAGLTNRIVALDTKIMISPVPYRIGIRRNFPGGVEVLKSIDKELGSNVELQESLKRIVQKYS